MHVGRVGAVVVVIMAADLVGGHERVNVRPGIRRHVMAVHTAVDR